MRPSISFTAVLVALTAGAATTSTAQAAPSIGASTCNGKTYYATVATYSNPGHASLPLRCGNAKFGLNHIHVRGHLDANTSQMIQTTLTYGEQKDDGAKELFDSHCNLLYTVAYGYNAYNKTDQHANPVGVITAYPPDPIIIFNTVGSTNSSVLVGGYRKDCPHFTPIDWNK